MSGLLTASPLVKSDRVALSVFVVMTWWRLQRPKSFSFREQFVLDYGWDSVQISLKSLGLNLENLDSEKTSFSGLKKKIKASIIYWVPVSYRVLF